MDRMSRLSDLHHHPHLPPHNPAAAAPALTAPPVSSSFSHHHSVHPQQTHSSAPSHPAGAYQPPSRTLPNPYNPTGPTNQQSYHPSTPHGPPTQFPATNKAEGTPEHSYGADRSAHDTPLTRHPPEFPPPQSHPPEQQMDAVNQQYAVPNEQAHSYIPSPYHAQQPPPHMALVEQQSSLQPLTDPNMFAPPQAGFPAHPYQYYPPVHPQTLQAQMAKTKKAARAQQACEKCRDRKSRCDEQKPCQSCKDQGLECRYRDDRPTKISDKNMGSLVSEQLDSIANKLEALASRMSNLEEGLGRPSASPKTLEEAHRRNRKDTPAAEVQSSIASTNGHPKNLLPNSALDSYSTFDEHTTAAHKLIIFWPSIYALLNSAQPSPPTSGYVMQVEARGPLRLYGLGEADESGETGAFGAPSPAHSSGSDDMSPPTPLDTWGHQPALPRESKRSEPFTVGGLASDELPDLQTNTVIRLFESYKRHMHRLHPFLDLGTFSKFFDRFVQNYCTDRMTPHPSLAGLNGDAAFARPAKRKRSEPGVGSGVSNIIPQSYPIASYGLRRTPDRSLSVAIVYLVLALGKICEHKQPIPGTVQDEQKLRSMAPPPISNSNPYTASPAGLKPSPASPHSSSFTSTPPSTDPFKAGLRSPHASFDGSVGSDRKGQLNVEKLPGLAYYREACSILGDFADTNELGCAQARLLAGLYKGQLARVQESWSWIHDASRICRYWIKRERLDKRENPNIRPYPPGSREERREDLLLLVSWSCLQLESDILAELDYPHSGLSNSEETLPYPRFVVSEDIFSSMEVASAQKDKVAYYYTAQLFLRKRLNQIHSNLYGALVSQQDPVKLAEVLQENEDMIAGWKQKTSLVHDWHDDDPPATEILAARLRAKYYGAWYISTRPYLDYALHVLEKFKSGQTLEQATVDARGRLRPSELAIFRAISTMPEYHVIAKARHCIKMAMQSTVSLDRVPERLVVTNIMGTAHAQFGNMLVLSAAWYSGVPWASDLISRERLQQLFHRTVVFLRRLRFCSKTANADVEILQTIHRSIFGQSVVASEDGKFEAAGTQHTSFSSDT